MTRARLAAGLALLVVLEACGRAGPPLRAPRVQPPPVPAAAAPSGEGPAEPAPQGAPQKEDEK